MKFMNKVIRNKNKAEFSESDLVKNLSLFQPSRFTEQRETLNAVIDFNRLLSWEQ